MAENHELMTAEEVQDLLKCDYRKVKYLCDSGHLRHIRLGPRTLRVFTASVNDFMNEGGAE